MPYELEDPELMLTRFNRLLAEVMHGQSDRNAFLPWEVEILLDMETCEIERRRRLEILRQYCRAVERQMEKGPGPPMKLSEFLTMRARRAADQAGKRKPVSIVPKEVRPPSRTLDEALNAIPRRRLA